MMPSGRAIILAPKSAEIIKGERRGGRTMKVLQNLLRMFVAHLDDRSLGARKSFSRLGSKCFDS